MEIILNITEDSKVELVKDSCEAVQGENNVTVLNMNLPSTIKGYSIDNFTRQIEFGECKPIGECKKFLDVFEGNTYKLCDICTQFEKIMIQITLTNLVDEAEPIVWKSIPFALEFCESINAENKKEVQTQLLRLSQIMTEWENYIRDNTFRVVSKVGDMPTADAASLGHTIFYLGANSTSPYLLTYGHYYRCNYVNNAYEWTDLTQDPSLEGVANGIREINHNQTMQVWLGTQEELENEVTQSNVLYIPEDEIVIAPYKKLVLEGNFTGGFLSGMYAFYIVLGEEHPDTFLANKHYEVHGDILGNLFVFDFYTDSEKGVYSCNMTRAKCWTTDGSPRLFYMGVTQVSGITIRVSVYLNPDNATIDADHEDNIATITKIFEIVEE